MLFNSASMNFVKIIYRVLLSFLIIVLILLFVLKVNDKVSFNDGYIYSDNPQIKINSPNEVRVDRILVKEGDYVKKGDTLLVLENIQTKVDYQTTDSDIIAMFKKIETIKSLIKTTEDKKIALTELLSIQSNIYKTDKKKVESEIAGLNKKIDYSNKQTEILSDRFTTDSLLYAKGAISKIELVEQRNKLLNDKKSESEIESSYNSKQYDYNNLTNNFNKTNNDLKRNLIEMDNQILEYNREIIDLESQIKNKEGEKVYLKDQLDKLMIIAPYDATVSQLFNSKQNLSIVNKNELLVILAPEQEHFYAKVTLPERDLIYLKKEQDVNLKLDAYNYYTYGAIKGNVSYISPSDVEENFYCLVKLRPHTSQMKLKAGYKLKGDIIIDEMRLYQYIIKKLFKKIDNTVNPS